MKESHTFLLVSTRRTRLGAKCPFLRTFVRCAVVNLMLVATNTLGVGLEIKHSLNTQTYALPSWKSSLAKPEDADRHCISFSLEHPGVLLQI